VLVADYPLVATREYAGHSFEERAGIDPVSAIPTRILVCPALGGRHVAWMDGVADITIEWAADFILGRREPLNGAM
jgi:hypothetical protein